jgi:hypothetical protein
MAVGAEADALHRLGKPIVDLLARQPGEPAGVGKIIERGEAVVEADLIGQVADPALDLERVAQRVVAGDFGVPFGRLGQT